MNVDALITLVILLAFLVLTVTGRLAVDIALAAAMTGLFGIAQWSADRAQGRQYCPASGRYTATRSRKRVCAPAPL